MLDRLDDTPAQVITDLGDVLAQNAMAAALLGDVSARPPAARNIVRRCSPTPRRAALFPAEDREDARPRTMWRICARCSPPGPTTRGPAALVAELRAGQPRSSPACGTDHEVAVRRSDVKRFLHPVVGELDLDCEVLLSPDTTSG